MELEYVHRAVRHPGIFLNVLFRCSVTFGLLLGSFSFLSAASPTYEPYQPDHRRVVVAKSGIATLPNGLTIRLDSIGVPQGSTTWNLKGVPTPRPNTKGWFSEGYGRPMTAIRALDRNAYGSIRATGPQSISLVSYLTSPTPQPFSAAGYLYGDFGYGQRVNELSVDPSIEILMRIWIPAEFAKDAITYRIGVGNSPWRTVLDVPNPKRGNPNHETGGVSLLTSPALRIDRTPIPVLLDPIHPGSKLSRLVPRRVIFLDKLGKPISMRESFTYAWYPLNARQLGNCSRIVVQERDIDWAEFRDLPMKKSLASYLHKPAGIHSFAP